MFKSLLSLTFVALVQAIEVEYGSVQHFQIAPASSFDHGACPCFNNDHLQIFSYGSVSTAEIDTCGNSPEGVHSIGSDSEQESAYYGVAQVVDIDGEGVYVCGVGNPATEMLERKEISEAQYEACKEMVVESCNDVDLPIQGEL